MTTKTRIEITKHTPGPWERSHPCDDPAAPVAVFGWHGGDYRDLAIIDGINKEADAALIAAAPELLESLEAVLLRQENEMTLPSAVHPAKATQAQFDAQPFVQKARAAIAKAKGQVPA